MIWSLHGTDYCSNVFPPQRDMLTVYTERSHVQRQIIVIAPCGQAAHLIPVVFLFSAADETHHSHVIWNLMERLHLCWCAVIGQLSEEEEAQHTSNSCVQSDDAGCVPL